eukprot:CAMPEP_0119104144 /NCGR_PEP_ID=MMETSP1180-20130426/2434_1 /TAXON_ID=3052 ORGANISM="Chlamydomonas cf sp, Strain CCMP681" /NCGR_SAMPLE_ID=MMETSP1180 /ASSEMBLY_ACC=CAM_ASM_000741 /LENGTH=89 /DNA_ID=CAMNT_0007088825 /DNA_START=110 /DNA_END=380 /DNA_ORIENTATION=-
MPNLAACTLFNQKANSSSVQGLRDSLAEQAKGDRILRAAIKEPLAFWGGMFAGALGLNLKEDPLRAWVERTASMVSGSSPNSRGNSTEQ